MTSLQIGRHVSRHFRDSVYWTMNVGGWYLPNKTATGYGKIAGVFSRSITSGEVFTALKPFFFAVHPDLFYQFPKEREVNENSLKQLNAYIESASNERPINQIKLTFFIRTNSNAKLSSQDSRFQSVSIDLGHGDVRRTVYTILEKCNLPTSFMDNIPFTQPQWTAQSPNSINHQPPFWTSHQDLENAEQVVTKKMTQDDLLTFLSKNVQDALAKLVDSHPIREEVHRLKTVLCSHIGIEDIRLECGWSVTHFRGCLESFQILVTQHPEIVNLLKGRILVFGRETGVSMDGHVILNSGEVRRNWLDVIRNVSKHDSVILRIPSVQKALSRSLKEIRVVHRKFQPYKMAENYEAQLKKLTTSLGDFRGKACFPKDWPNELSHLELVVETDAGPLMVSPTGQIIVPASCPPFLLVNFISESMREAVEKLDLYKRQKYEEIDLHDKCLLTFDLLALDKDDNITPNLMIDCCNRLLSNRTNLLPLLKGTRLWITTYYSILSGGEICIPWNWKVDKF